LIEANAAVDMGSNYGSTALMYACDSGHHECARALIDANAAVDTVDNYGFTALMRACDWGHHECAQALIDAGAAVDMVNNGGQTALMIACESPPPLWLTQSQRQGRIRCALALLEATAPIREAGFSDRAASLKFAGERLQLIEAVLASPHVIEDAPPLASVRDLQTDAQGVFINFASDRLERSCPSPVVDPAGLLPGVVDSQVKL
jgi:hypothetical protein